MFEAHFLPELEIDYKAKISRKKEKDLTSLEHSLHTSLGAQRA